MEKKEKKERELTSKSWIKPLIDRYGAYTIRSNPKLCGKRNILSKTWAMNKEQEDKTKDMEYRENNWICQKNSKHK